MSDAVRGILSEGDGPTTDRVIGIFAPDGLGTYCQLRCLLPPTRRGSIATKASSVRKVHDVLRSS